MIAKLKETIKAQKRVINRKILENNLKFKHKYVNSFRIYSHK